MKKRLSLLVLALAMVMAFGLLTACGNGEENDTTPPAAEATPEPAVEETGEEPGEEVDPPEVTANGFDEHLTISMSMIDGDVAGRNDDGEWMPFVRYIMEKFNFDFDIYMLTWADWQAVTTMWLASGTAPDVLFQDVHYSRYGEFYVNATVNRFFRPYNLDNMPHAREVFESATGFSQAFMINGNLYAWPGFSDAVVRNPQEYPGGVIYRRDWAEAVGLATDDNVYTHDEWWNLVRTVLDENPGDVDNLIGTAVADDWMLPRYWSPGWLSPHAVRYSLGADGLYTWGPLLPETLEVARIFNSLYQEGLIWADQVLPQRERIEDMFRAGQSFSYTIQRAGYDQIHDAWRGWMTFNALYDDGTPANEIWDMITYEMTQFIGWAIVEAPQGGIQMNEPLDHWSHTIMSASISDANADRWEQILDWLVSDEGYFSRNLGIPGEDWVMGADGRPQVLWEEENGVLIHPNWGFHHDWLLRRLAGNSDSFDFFYRSEGLHPYTYEQALRSIAIGQGEMGHQINFIPRDIDLMVFTGETFLGVGALMNEIEEAMMTMMVSNNVEADWQAFIDSRWHLIEPVVDELNRELLGR